MNPAIRDLILGTAAPAAFAPSDLSGLAIWYDASDYATLTLDGSGNVSQWNDKSGNNRHAAQTDSNKRPAYLASGINGLPAVRGDGVDDLMTWTQFSSGVNHNFYLAVAYDTGVGSYPQYSGFFGGPTGSVTWNAFHQDTGTNPSVDCRVPFLGDVTVLAANTANNIKSGNPFVFSLLRNGGTFKAKQTYGTTQTQTGAGGYLTAVTASSRIFSNYNGSISFRIAEMVCYTRDLTASEEAQLSGYFSGRYGAGI